MWPVGVGGSAIPFDLLAEFLPPRTRGRVLTLAHPAGGSFTLLDDAYNANPVSMAAAIAALGAARPGEGGRRIASSALAAEAVHRMEEHAITSLLVEDEEGRICGVVHLHDLLRAGAA